MISKKEQDLARRLKSGDEHALLTISRRYRTLVMKIIGSRIIEPESKDEVFNDVLMALWRGRERIEPERGFRGLIVTIAGARTIDWLRRFYHQRRDGIEVSIESFSPISPEEGSSHLASESSFHTVCTGNPWTIGPGHYRNCDEHNIASGTPIVENTDLSDWLASEEDYAKAMALIDALPPKQREALVRVVNGERRAAVARDIGVDRSTITRWFHELRAAAEEVCDV